MAAQAYATQAAQRLAFRYRLGIFDAAASSDIGTLSDDELDEFLNAGRDEVNLAIPLWYFGSFTTVADQQRYTVSFPAAKIGIAKVFWAGSAVACGDIDPPTAFSSWGEFGVIASAISIGQVPYVNETVLELQARYLATLERYIGGRGWEAADGKVWLAPVPQTTGTNVYYFAPIERYSTPLEVTREHSNALMDAACMRAFQTLAAKQSEALEADDGALVNVKTAGGDVFLKLAARAERKFRGALGKGRAAGLSRI